MSLRGSWLTATSSLFATSRSRSVWLTWSESLPECVELSPNFAHSFFQRLYAINRLR